MTTIAFDGKTLAADTQLTFDTVPLYCRKIHRIPEKYWIWSCAGDTHVEADILAWVRGGADAPERNRLKKFEAFIYDYKEKKIWFMNHSIHLQPVVDKYFTLGSGWASARAAMLLGLPAKDAVKFAADVDIYTNSYVDTYDVETDTITQVRLPCHR